jgi:5-formyltetrahydrofolate cyclo-ligase
MKNKTELRQEYKGCGTYFLILIEKSLAVAKILTLPIWENTYFHIFLAYYRTKEVNTNLFCTYYPERQRNYRFKGRF